MNRHVRNTREALMDAAEDVVIEVGARHLTLDAVAAKSGVSKGGLLYHFHTKGDLLEAMLQRRVALIGKKREEKLARLPGEQKSRIIAYVLSLLEEDEKGSKVSVALLAAAAHDPRLLVPYKEESRRLIEDFQRSGAGFEAAAVTMLAANGLKFLELLSLSPFSRRERNRIIKKIIALSKEEIGA